MIQVVDRIETFLNSIDYAQAITSSEIIDGVTIITLPKVYHTRKYMVVTIDTIDYTVLSVSQPNHTISITGELDTPILLTIPKPNYFHGTVRAVQNQLKDIENKNKTPLIYLHEVIDEEIPSEWNESLDIIAPLRMFFLNETKDAGMLTDDYYADVMNGMRELTDYIINEFKEYRLFYKISNTNIKNITHFGTYSDNSGHLKKLFTDRLAGTDLRLTVPFRKILQCH